jgi:hypothetical protein
MRIGKTASVAGRNTRKSVPALAGMLGDLG